MENSNSAAGHGERSPSWRRALDPAVARMLASRRRALGWSVREAACRAGISPGMLAMMEAGQRSPSVPLSLAVAVAYGLGEPDVLMLRSAALSGVGRDSPYRRVK